MGTWKNLSLLYNNNIPCQQLDAIATQVTGNFVRPTECAAFLFYFYRPKIGNGENTTLVWDAVDFDSCTIHQYQVPLSGEYVFENLSLGFDLTMSCYNGGVLTEHVTTIDVDSMDFYFSPSTISAGGSTTLHWNIDYGKTCTVLEPNVELHDQGSYLFTDIYSDLSLTLSCEENGVTKTAVAEIKVI